MKKNLWKRLSRIGVTDEMDFRLARRVILSNQFALLIASLTLVFMVVFASRQNFNFVPFLVLLFIAIVIWLFNHAGLTRLSRMVTSLTPAVGLLFLNVSLKFGDPSKIDILHYATPRMLILGSAVLPFTMFTPVERRFVWATVGIILVLAFGYDSIHSSFGVDYQALGLKNNFYGVIYEDMVVLAIMILVSSGFMFNLGNQYDLKTQKLLNEDLEQTELLRRNEEEIKKTLHELEESRKKDQERDWVSKGLTGLITILQSSDDTSKVYDKLLSTLVKYTRMNQGAMFLTTESESGETILKLVSCYAYERKKFVEGTIEPGNGILGQAYLEGELCYMREVPADFVRITSGLGEATPRHVAIVPMKTNKTVEGLFELASFQPMEERHFELFQKVGETLASFVSNNRINDRTKTLLQKAQVMSEELKANEEEMRQNLEELTATQEAMARKEKEYQERIAELEHELVRA
ncbi:MAG: GAF domain-containing protein [Bacteroidota bacterium]